MADYRHYLTWGICELFASGKQILIIDPTSDGEEMQAILRSLGARVSVVTDAVTAVTVAAREEFDMALIAVELAGERPGELLRLLRKRVRIPSLLMLTRPADVRQAIRALSLGADDYLLKPPARAEVLARVGRILRAQQLDDREGHLHREMSRRYLVGNLVARSRGMRRVRNQILQVAPARSTVLIEGESGVGKELVAKAIHYNSGRRKGPYVAINCSAIPGTLIESELFGHERGAFTGAVERQKGKFELAHGGTMLLDEIGEMSLATQVKLLRVLEERSFMRVGGGREVRVDVRVLAATNSDLEGMIAAGRFREDLYFRLHVITIRVPPLRERVEDIPELARVFLGQICQDNGLRTKTLTAKAIHALRRHSWPGNVRELKNVLESTAIIHPGELVRLTALPATVRETGGRVRRRTPKPAGVSLRDVERDVLRRALTQHHGNRTHAARSLRIGVRTLQRKIKTYGIDVPYAAGRRSTQRSTETPRPSASSHGRM